MFLYYLEIYLTIIFSPSISSDIKPYLYDFISICKEIDCSSENIHDRFSKLTTINIPEHYEDPVYMQCNYNNMQLSIKRSEFFNPNHHPQSLIDHEMGHCLFNLAHIDIYKNQSLAIMEKRPIHGYSISEINFWIKMWRKNLFNPNNNKNSVNL